MMIKGGVKCLENVALNVAIFYQKAAVRAPFASGRRPLTNTYILSW
jgi:hypothetical protein